MWTPERIEELLWTKVPIVGLAAIRQLYETDRELFYQLACVGVRPQAEKWMRELAILAAHLRIMCSTYMPGGDPDRLVIESCYDDIPALTLNGLPRGLVCAFLQTLNGISSGPISLEERMRGQRITQAEADFKIGSRDAAGNWIDSKATYFARRVVLSDS
jgi:hypothetical protein